MKYHEVINGEQLRLLLLAAVVAISVVVLIVIHQLDTPDVSLLPPLEPELPDVGEMPDFAAIRDVSEMKESFFDFLLPVIEAKNDWILDNRNHLRDLEARMKEGDVPTRAEQRRLEALGQRYRLAVSDPVTAEELEALLLRVDVIPPSLALAQAAAESGWGRSRFAREGNNLFGEWCFREGCGIVPQRRIAGATHEVARFDSVTDAVESYFRNLNGHPAYEPMRELRAEARAENGVVLGPQLVPGLEQYSERGGDYLDELRLMIRVNRLSRLDLPEEFDTAQLIQ